MDTIERPDISGYALFCDDIRMEVGGKASLIGVYNGHMYVNQDFPITLPKIGIQITVSQRKELFTPNMTLQIFLPGDPDQKPSIESSFEEKSDGDVAAQVEASSPPTDESAREFIAMHANFIAAPLKLVQPGAIKIRAVIGGRVLKVGALRILRAPPGAPVDSASG